MYVFPGFSRVQDPRGIITAKRAEKRKAAEEVVVEEEVEVVDGPGEETRPKKRSKTVESNVGPDGEAEMEAAETACKR